MDVFIRDGFIDRFSGEKLYNPGLLRSLSILLPEALPFHPHGKTNFCHHIFWDSLPSLDHLRSLHRGGEDNMGNYITTSMKRNLAKNNWSIDDLGWTLHPKGNIEEWDGMSQKFLDLVNQFYELWDTPYVRDWFKVTKKKLGES